VKVWLEEVEAHASAFRVEVRGLGTRLAKRKLLAAGLAESSVLRRSQIQAIKTSGKPQRGCAATLLGREGQVLVWREGDAGAVVAEAWGDPAPVVRTVEALCLRLQPAGVRLVAGDGASPWRTYPPEGALFVREVHTVQSEFQTISVGEHPVYGRMLFLNGETQIATSDEPRYSAALVKAGLRASTRRVCILGGGDCGVLREVLTHAHVSEVVMVEIDRQVVLTAEEWFPQVVGGARDDARARIVYLDANRFLQEEAQRIATGESSAFDLIVYDLSDAPLADASFDALSERVKACLAQKGRVAIQCGSALPMYHEHLASHRRGLQRHFRRVRLREEVIPSFLEQPWVFASARV
jgi:spermidine synthase